MNFNYHSMRCKPSISPNSYRPIKDNETKQGLGITPSQAMELTQSGHAISLQNFNTVFDGVTELTPPIDFENRRGVDMADAWNASESAKSRLIRAHRKDVADFG